MSAARKIVYTDKAPLPLKGTFSQAIVANGTVYCSGVVGMDAAGKLLDGDIQTRTHQIIKNFGFVLEAAGTSLENVVKVNVYLTDMKDFATVNEVYIQYFGDEKPCRTCIGVKQLPLGTDVEMECVAVLP